MMSETDRFPFESVFLQRGSRDSEVFEMTQHGTVSLFPPFIFSSSCYLCLPLLLPSLYFFSSLFCFLFF